jgi:hypothetical protein
VCTASKCQSGGYTNILLGGKPIAMEPNDKHEAKDFESMKILMDYYKNQFEAMRLALAVEKERFAALEKKHANCKPKADHEEAIEAAPASKKRRREEVADDETQMSAFFHHISMNDDQPVRRVNRNGRSLPVRGSTGIPKILGRDKEPYFSTACVLEDGKCKRSTCRFFHPDQEAKFGHMRDTLVEYTGTWKPKSKLAPE